MIGALAFTLLGLGQASELPWATDLGRGNIGLADPNGLGMVLRSPGTLDLMPRYELAAGYAFGPDMEQGLQLAAVDSLTSPAALAISYQRIESTPLATADEVPGWVEPGEDFSNPKSLSILGLSLANSWHEGLLGFGIGVYHVRSDSRFGEEIGNLDVSLGVSSHMAEILTIALSVDHLVPYETRYAPFQTGLGLHIGGVESVGEVGGEVRMALPSGSGPVLSGAVGTSLYLVDFLVIRGGHEWDRLNDMERLGLGIGLRSDTARLDYGFALDRLEAKGSREFWNTVGLRIQL